MTTCDPIEMQVDRSSLSSMLKLLLFLVMQGAAVILVGFAALFLSFEPVWSADGPQATVAGLSDARSGSLLLKTDDGDATDATRLGSRCRPHGLRSDDPGPRHADFPQPDAKLGGGDLRLSAAGRRRGRYAQDGGRRPRHRRRYQGATTGPRHLRAGPAERTEGCPDRAGTAQHLHQLGCQYRPRRNRAGADRIPGAGPSIRQ